MFYFFPGFVRVEITGKYVELFLNRCIENNIHIWKVKRIDHNTISCYFSLRDRQNIRKLLRRTGCKLSFKERRGLPFILKKLKSRKGIVAGLTFCLFVILMCSNMIWSIKINGASPELEHQVRQALQQEGIRKGKLIFFLPSEQAIQQSITEQTEDVTWIGVKRLGTQYSFEIVEKSFPEEKPALNPRNLIAKKKAIIHKMFVEQGQAIVSEQDYVKKGELLVTGKIGTEDHEKIVPAKATVLGEVWYLSQVTIPLESKVVTNTGKKVNRHYLHIGKLQIPIWGFSKEQYKQKETLVDEKSFYFIKWKLPIKYVNKSELEVEEIKRERTKKQAVDKAIEMTEQALKRKLSKDAEINGKKVLQEKIDSGKVNVKIHYQVIEDIATEQPIIRGD